MPRLVIWNDLFIASTFITGSDLRTIRVGLLNSDGLGGHPAGTGLRDRTLPWYIPTMQARAGLDARPAGAGRDHGVTRTPWALLPLIEGLIFAERSPPSAPRSIGTAINPHLTADEAGSPAGSRSCAVLRGGCTGCP